jgi:hypothetical protein
MEAVSIWKHHVSCYRSIETEAMGLGMLDPDIEEQEAHSGGRPSSSECRRRVNE